MIDKDDDGDDDDDDYSILHFAFSPSLLICFQYVDQVIRSIDKSETLWENQSDRTPSMLKIPKDTSKMKERKHFAKTYSAALSFKTYVDCVVYTFLLIPILITLKTDLNFIKIFSLFFPSSNFNGNE